MPSKPMTDYERGARDMQDRAVAVVDGFCCCTDEDLAGGNHNPYCIAHEVAPPIRALSLTPETQEASP